MGLTLMAISACKTFVIVMKIKGPCSTHPPLGAYSSKSTPYRWKSTYFYREKQHDAYNNADTIC